ncbi:MAG TPA: ATP-binding protein [Candidatus Dormibacteraeota bacterium]
MSVGESRAHAPSESFAPTEYARAVLNILEDFGDEKERLQQTQRAVLNILDDFGDERERFETIQKAMLNILEDFGDEKQRLEDMQRAVLNILDDLDMEKRSAQEANRMKSEFLANMSHELRTPLNAIIGFAKLMAFGKVGPVSAQHQEFLVDILKSSDHLLRLINDVLDLAKVEAGKMEFHPEPIDLVQLVGEVRDILRAVAATKQIQIDTAIDPSCTGLELDAAKLKQVLYNYLSNALKFTPDNGRVFIRARPESTDLLRIEVQDTGIGIRADDVRDLFAEFRQLDSSASKKYQGTGLGLALTKRIVEAQGGRVGVDSQLGSGSTFFVVLPQRPPSPALRGDA